MIDRKSSRYSTLLAAGTAVGAAGFLVLAGDAVAGPKQLSAKKRAAVVSRVEVPLGLQGIRGAGANVVVPFTLVDASRAKTNVDVQYGLDLNSDGSITDDEYRPATEDRLDPRNTRKNRKPQLFVTAGDVGATQAFVWRSTSDIQSARYETQLYSYTDQGRLIPDKNFPGEFEFDKAQAGVRIRVRAVRGSGGSKLVGSWVVTDALALNNNATPAMTIDQVLSNASGAASDEVVQVLWTGIDPDSEDQNDNGVFDSGEDLNGDGIFGQEQIGVAFDYYRLQASEDPSSMTDEELAGLKWLQCTKAGPSFGDTDSFRTKAGDGVVSVGETDTEDTDGRRVYGTPNGRQWKFGWDSITDVGTVRDMFILRARPVDSKKENGPSVYQRTPFQIDNTKVFSSAAGKQPAIELSSVRTGCSVTNLVYGLEQSDASYGKPFQLVLVVGGASSATGAAVTTVDLFRMASETADTMSGSRSKDAAQLANPRSFHSATALSDGRVLFVGGFNAAGNPTGTTEIYDPKSQTMTAGPVLGTPRARHTAVLLSTNDVAIIGGVGAGGSLLSSIEIIHPEFIGAPSGAIEVLGASLATPQHSASAVLLPDQTVLITGGITGSANDSGTAVQNAELLNPLAGSANPPGTIEGGEVRVKNPTLTVLPVSMLEPRKRAGATPLLDGNVLFTGGASGGQVSSTLEVFNWRTRTFQSVNATIPDAGRASHVAALLGNGTVLIAGGATTDAAAPGATGKAAVFQIGALNGTTWDGQFLPVNGDMIVARRGASAAGLMNGRVFVAGGLDPAGATTSTVEIFTPDLPNNAAPKAYVSLPSSDLSHKYGATVYYRLCDAESDRARVVLQFRAPLGTAWNACTPQDSTIGGDVADVTADLLTDPRMDLSNAQLAIDPIAKNTLGDHSYIWSMQADIVSPLPGQSIAGYNVRVLPFTSVRGVADVSAPVNVLQNTKPVSIIMPLEDSGTRTQDIRQGGDVDVTIHVRDIDGEGTGARNGDPCSVYYEYAIDRNGDGQIVAPLENFVRMTPAGEPRTLELGGAALANPLAGVQSWSEGPQDPSSDPAGRSPTKGWNTFTWDALYDVGAPLSTLGYQANNIWIRATASDKDTGFPKVLRNADYANPDQFTYIRDAKSFYLESFKPISATGAAPYNAVRVNEPIVFTFNGNVDGVSANPNTIKIFRRLNASSTSAIKGVFVTKTDTPTLGKSQVTFFPQTQESDSSGSPVYGPNDTATPTVFFPFNQYTFSIPGYQRTDLPGDDIPPMVRPVVTDTLTSTYQRVNSGPCDGDLDAQFRFGTTSGVYDNGLAVAPSGTVAPIPAFGSSLPGAVATSRFTVTFNHSIDYTTAKSPAITVLGNNGALYVVPGRWQVVNKINPDGSSTGQLTFVPLLSLPSNDRIVFTTNNLLLGTNGRQAASLSGTYSVSNYGTKTVSTSEGFSNMNQRDSTGTTASWGDDKCLPGVLTGLQDGSSPPVGGSALVVTAGQTIPLTATTADYSSITVAKGGKLVLQATGPMLLRCTGNVQIDGTVDYSGQDGASGSMGYSAYYYYGPTYAPSGVQNGRRAGGTGYLGGGKGGDSTFVSSGFAPGTTGGNGSGTTLTGGGGGQFSSSYSFNTNTFYYGGGGGSGGGHGTAGLVGGWNTSYPGNLAGILATVGAKSTNASDFSGGISAGGGGGGGGAPAFSSYYHSGGAGGAGAGALTIVCDGTFTLGVTGLIDGSGGEGGANSHYSGAGAGGAGGGLWIKAGNTAKLDGLIDLRGGRGGPTGASGNGYGDPNLYINTTVYGSNRYGGDGGLGRFTIEAPNFLSSNVDEVRVFGQMIVRSVTSIPTTTLSYGAPPAELTGTTTGVLPKDLGGTTTDYAYTSIDVPYNRIVRLSNGTGITSKAIRLFVSGTVNIGGTLNLHGNGPDNDVYNASVLPYSNSVAAATNLTSTQYSTSYANYSSGYYGIAGGGDGGASVGSSGSGPPSGSYFHEAKDGNGPINGTTGAPGKHKYKLGQGYGSFYWATGDLGGAGAGNASAGKRGWTTYQNSTALAYTGAVQDTTGNGVSAAQNNSDCSVPGGVVDSSTLSASTIANFAGSGGGGGNAGGWVSQPYYPFAGTGGGGGGALAIICQGTINLQSGSVISMAGGDGNSPGAAYVFYSARAAGGAGSGGTLYLVGKDVNIAKVITGEGGTQTTAGAMIDLHGGNGGGWRQPFTGTRNAYPWYNTHGNFGGDGGFGRVVIEYTSSLNGVSALAGGKTLANRWGMEQTVFNDAQKQWAALAGTYVYKCRAIPTTNAFRSTFVDLGSLRPTVTAMTAAANSNANYGLFGQGAQSHPNLPGSGTGQADSTNVSPLQTGSALMSYSGWRWWRFSGTFARLLSTGAQPTLDNVTTTATTDVTATVPTNP